MIRSDERKYIHIITTDKTTKKSYEKSSVFNNEDIVLRLKKKNLTLVHCVSTETKKRIGKSILDFFLKRTDFYTISVYNFIRRVAMLSAYIRCLRQQQRRQLKTYTRIQYLN